MQTLLRITRDENGSISGYVDKTDNCSESVYLKVFKYLKQFDPSLRRKAAKYEGPHPFLAEALVTWRRVKANTLDIPPFFILNQRVLFAIADAVPQTEEELMNIPGFGASKLEKYGAEILKFTTDPVV